MTAGSAPGKTAAPRPGAAGGHCRVTVVAPTRRVDVALPEDVPLAELLPELLRLVGTPVPAVAAGAAALNGYVLTGVDGAALDTAASLADQGVVHGGVLRLRPAGDVPEAAVHDDIADAVAEAVLAGGTQWSATALRATALTVVGIAAGLGAVVLWFSGTGTFHGWKGVIAGVIALLLFSLGVLRARYDLAAVGRGSYYGYGDGPGPEPSPQDGRRSPVGRSAAARLETATRGQARYMSDDYGGADDPYSESLEDFEARYTPEFGSEYGRGYRDPGAAESHYSPDLGPYYGRDHRGAYTSSDPRYDYGVRPGHGSDPRADFGDGPDYGQRFGRGYREPEFGPDARHSFAEGSDYGRDPRRGDPGWRDDYRGAFGYDRDPRNPGAYLDPRRDLDEPPDYGRDPRSPRFGGDPRFRPDSRFETDPRFDPDSRFDPDPRLSRDRRLGSDSRFGPDPRLSADRRLASNPRLGPDPRLSSDSRFGLDPRDAQGRGPGYRRERRDPRFRRGFGVRRRFLRGRAGYPSDPDFAAPAATFDLASFGADQVPGQHGSGPRTLGAATVVHATASVRTGGLGGLAAWPTVAEAMAWATGAHHRRDYTAAALLTASSLPYAFIAGVGVLPAHAADGHGLGRVHFIAGAVAVLVMALAAIVGLGRRVAVPVAGVTVGLVAALTGIGLLLTKASPAAGIAVAAAACALVIEALPFAAMAAARFVIEPPTSGVEPGEFDGSPVNNYVVGLRVARTLDTLTGLTAGVGVVLVLCVALLVVPIAPMQTSPAGMHTVWEQALALLVSGVMLCRARLFRERAQVLAAALSGLTGLVLAFGAMAANAAPTVRALWLAPLLVLIALLALGLASIRPRRGTSEPILPPRWSRTVDFVEGALFLAVLPVLMAVLGVYGEVRNLKG